jgi:hypothetical protein
MRRLRLRSVAVFLAALFLGGVGGAADVDALLFHAGRAVVPLTGPHYEPAGAPNHHADHCLLTLRVAGGRSAPSAGRMGRAVVPLRTFAGPTLAAAPLGFLPGLHQESRAPPAALA